MAAHRYWRAVGIETYGLAGLEITEFHLLAGTTRVDASATLTSNIAPATGSLANLKDDDTATGATWDAVDLKTLVLSWDFGPGGDQDVTDIRIGAAADAKKFLIAARLLYSDDGSTWLKSVPFVGIAWPGARVKTSSSAPADQALFHFDGANGATTITEVGGKTVTKVGTAVNISTTQSMFGGASGAFTGGYVQVPIAAVPGDFTFIGSFYWDGTTGNKALFSISGRNIEAYLQAANIAFFDNVLGTIFVSATTITANAWHTAYVARKDGQIYFWIDGVLHGSANFPYPLPAGNLNIGAYVTGSDAMRGYMDEVLFVNGDALFADDAFVAPVAAFAGLAGPRIVRNPVRGRVGISLPISLASAASTAYSYGTMRLSSAVRGRQDFVSGVLGQGIGRVKGTTKDKGSPNVPVSERVRLYREQDGLLMREMWSAAGTGAYSFDYIDELQTYTVISYDHDKAFRAVVADGLTLANGGVELIV